MSQGDPYSLFGLRVGRVEGELKALGQKVDGMDHKLDQLLTREDERVGAAKALASVDATKNQEANRRTAAVSAMGGGSLVFVLQMLGRKFGWWT